MTTATTSSGVRWFDRTWAELSSAGRRAPDWLFMSAQFDVGWQPIARTTVFDDPAAIALRAAMTAEMLLRYFDWDVSATPLPPAMDVTADDVAWTGVVLSGEGLPVGHALLRWYGQDLELKRMYVAPSHRGTGVSRALLEGLEDAARALRASRVVLHTGARQPDAVRLYEKHGYTRIPVLPGYASMPGSMCYEKLLGSP